MTEPLSSYAMAEFRVDVLQLGIAAMLGSARAEEALTKITAEVLVGHHSKPTSESQERYEAILQAWLLVVRNPRKADVCPKALR